MCNTYVTRRIRRCTRIRGLPITVFCFLSISIKVVRSAARTRPTEHRENMTRRQSLGRFLMILYVKGSILQQQKWAKLLQVLRERTEPQLCVCGCGGGAPVISVQRISKKLRIPCPAFPTGLSSSLNTSQLMNICLTSAQNSSRDLYLYREALFGTYSAIFQFVRIEADDHVRAFFQRSQVNCLLFFLCLGKEAFLNREYVQLTSSRWYACNLHGVLQFLLDRTEIHGCFNNFLVGRKLFGVHRQEERPGLVLLLQLFEQHLTRSQLSLLFLRERPIVSLLPWRSSWGCRFR